VQVLDGIWLGGMTFRLLRAECSLMVDGWGEQALDAPCTLEGRRFERHVLAIHDTRY